MRDANTKLSRGFGFVCFAEASDASKAVDDMNETSMDGKKLYVAFAQPKAVRAQQMQVRVRCTCALLLRMARLLLVTVPARPTCVTFADHLVCSSVAKTQDFVPEDSPLTVLLLGMIPVCDRPTPCRLLGVDNLYLSITLLTTVYRVCRTS